MDKSAKRKVRTKRLDLGRAGDLKRGTRDVLTGRPTNIPSGFRNYASKTPIGYDVPESVFRDLIRSLQWEAEEEATLISSGPSIIGSTAKQRRGKRKRVDDSRFVGSKVDEYPAKTPDSC